MSATNSLPVTRCAPKQSFDTAERRIAVLWPTRSDAPPASVAHATFSRRLGGAYGGYEYRRGDEASEFNVS